MSKAFFEGSNKKYIYKEQNLLTLQVCSYFASLSQKTCIKPSVNNPELIF